ncbi:MAG: ZIP family metal transporter, partial [Comamonadaceae bacterium]
MTASDASAAIAPQPRWTPRRLMGLALVIFGACLLAVQSWQFVRSSPVVWQALMGGSVAALATALGALPVLFSQRLSDRVQDTLFGFGAGVMLAACAFSLIIPGLEAAKAQVLWG